MLETVVTILIALPVLAACMLALFALVLKPLRNIPAHEYEQLLRVPAWMAVVCGGAIFFLALVALSQMAGRGAQVFIGWSLRDASLMIDSYTLWAAAVLGAVLAVASWVPAARRSLVPHALPYFVGVLVLAGLALFMLFSVQFTAVLASWLGLLSGAIILWALLFRPRGRWEQLEPVIILGVAMLLGGIGLLWLRSLTYGSDLPNMWSALLSSPPKATNSAMLLITLGWVGPAIYLPWWIWGRREEAAMVWLPLAVLLPVVGVLALVRLLFFIFPAGGGNFVQLPGVEHVFLLRQLLNWLLAWGILALLVGAGWLAYAAAMRRPVTHKTLRPVTLVAAGLLLLGLAGGVLGAAEGWPSPHVEATAGLLWLVLAWAGNITIWLSVTHLLPVLAASERGERLSLYLACWVATAMLVACPFTAGYWGLVNCWTSWQQYHTPPALVVAGLLVSAGSLALLLPRWQRTLVAQTPRVGAGWGILGPFMLACALLLCGFCAGPLHPLFLLIRQSLLQAY